MVTDSVGLRVQYYGLTTAFKTIYYWWTGENVTHYITLNNILQLVQLQLTQLFNLLLHSKYQSFVGSFSIQVSTQT